MSTVGIIAEYNPFHTGHAYQIAKARELTGAHHVVVVMSGDYVQRGHAAIMDKYLRTRLALMGGADFVIELPVWVATASAADFAEGGVALLTALGCVDYLCFGSEEGDLLLLEQAARIFLEEPPLYRTALRSALSAGRSFPKARRIAWEAVSGLPGDFLEQPNNILGISYLMAIRRQNSPLKPVTVARKGDFHNSELHGEYASASALRAGMLRFYHPEDHCDLFSTAALQSEDPTAQCVSAIPQAEALTAQALPYILRSFCPTDDSWQLWNREYGHSYPMLEELFWPVLKARLITCAEHAERFYDFPDGLARRLQKYYFTGRTYQELAESLQTALYTRSRIDRALLHLLLDIKEEEVSRWKQEGYVQYARILGFRRAASGLFREMKHTCRIPILTKALPEDKDLLSPASAYALDLAASNLYESMRSIVYPEISAVHELRRGIITL